jgi:hypothetical protein
VAAARSKGIGAGAVAAIVIVIGVLALIGRSHQTPPVSQIGTGCLVRGSKFDIPLSTGQAAIAATIAGVAEHRAMPARAVTIAYATALQESDLENLPYGDRDSVGVFQQRPSQGWGTKQQILNPVYATTRFFAALAQVPNYRRLLVYQAAQDVQRSADGLAYSQYSIQGAAMASGFAGWLARAVYCWYGSGISDHARLTAADRDLATTFGPLPVSRSMDPVMTVKVPNHEAGWSVASWLVTHASSYGISTVRFASFQWTAAQGQHGWIKYRPSRRRPAPKLAVVFG